MVNICIPTLNSYDTLEKCINSINNSTIKIDNIFVIDNGGNYNLPYLDNVHVIKVAFNIGLAASWNKFITEVPEYRIICNDDIEFHEDAIEIIINSYDENSLIFPNNISNFNQFSCFLLPQKIVDIVGLFDEDISPRYAYFEDNDYSYRMGLMGIGAKPCNASISHVGSSTLKHFSIIEEESHHKRFRLAQDNYFKKWGGNPDYERFTTPYGR